MSTVGLFKYICEDCKEENWLTARDRNSRFRPRCRFCGSTWLTPSKRSISKERLTNQHDYRKQAIEEARKKQNYRPKGEQKYD